MRARQLIAVGVFVVGCQKASPAPCPAGTEQIDAGICLQRGSASASASASASSVPIILPPGACESSCKRVATCRGLSGESELISTRCTTECDVLTHGDRALLRDLIACREKEPCERAEACEKAYEEMLSKNIRQPKDTDPVAVTKVSVSEDGRAQAIALTYQNRSPKDIDGIKFRFYCRNNFDEPAGVGTLITQDPLKAASSSNTRWRIHNPDCTKAQVSLTQIHFTDGTSWRP